MCRRRRSGRRRTASRRATAPAARAAATARAAARRSRRSRRSRAAAAATCRRACATPTARATPRWRRATTRARCAQFGAIRARRSILTPSPSPHQVRVSNLSEDVKDSDLRELFRRFGAIQRIYLAKDRDTRASRGFAFINFFDRGDAQRAIDKLDGHGYDHLILSVGWANPAAAAPQQSAPGMSAEPSPARRRPRRRRRPRPATARAAGWRGRTRSDSTSTSSTPRSTASGGRHLIDLNTHSRNY